MVTRTTTLTDHTLDTLARRAPATDDLLELAAWLHANGHRHLSAIERVELAERLISRRRFLIGAGALLLAGCGAPGASAPTATVAATRTITDHAGRSITIPVDPQRVVAGYTTDIDVALVLGLPLIGGPGARGLATQPFVPYQPQEQLASLTRITTFPEANLEQIAALQPDLIIDSVGDYIEGRYALLSQIAPTFDVSGPAGDGWRAYLRAVAEPLGRAAQAEQFIAEYEARAADLRARLAERLPNATFALIGAYEPGTVWVSDVQMHPVKVLADDLGLRPAAIMPATSADRPNLSLERLDLLDEVNLLFLRVEPLESGAGRDRSIHDPLKASPLWQRLPAVQNGGLIEYDAELFYSSPLTAMALLDVVEQALLS
ncbi:MAG: hypothetical protein OHK0015_07670 [Chloroflexi bacterium OHK40]